MKKDEGRKKEEGRRMEEEGGGGHLASVIWLWPFWHWPFGNGHWSFDIGQMALAF